MNDNARKWVAALRSGEFEQAQGRLKDGDAYCCLGVACELYIRETGVGSWDERSSFLNGDGRAYSAVLPDELQTWLGVRADVASYAEGVCALTIDNDNGKTFTEIADIIESEPEGLFIQ